MDKEGNGYDVTRCNGYDTRAMDTCMHAMNVAMDTMTSVMRLDKLAWYCII